MKKLELRKAAIDFAYNTLDVTDLDLDKKITAQADELKLSNADYTVFKLGFENARHQFLAIRQGEEQEAARAVQLAERPA